MIVRNLKSALESAASDDAVGIKIASLTDEYQFAMHVTEIPASGKIGAHFHRDGVEIYQILSGKGEILTALSRDGAIYNIDRREIKEGDFFSINPNIVHQLVNTGNSPLILVFGCPGSHLSSDRVVTDDLI